METTEQQPQPEGQPQAPAKLVINNAFLKDRPLSQSSGKSFLESPMHYMQYLQKRFEATPAMILGSLVDCLITCPDEYESRFCIVSDDIKKPTSAQVNAKNPSPASVEQIKRYDEFLTANKRKQWIDQEVLDKAQAMHKAAMDNPVSAELLMSVTRSQQRYRWTDKSTGIDCVCIPDLESEKKIISLKSAMSADPDEFTKQAFNMNYPLQCGFELEAIKKSRVEFPEYWYLVIENTAPYAVSVHMADTAYVEYGKKLYRDLMDRFKFCMDNDMFHKGYEFRSLIHGWFFLDLPGWAKKKMEFENQ